MSASPQTAEIIELMRICKKCGIEKSVSEFNNNNRHKHLPLFVCKPCIAAPTIQRIKKQSEKKRAEINSTGAKSCSRCKRKKPLSEFYRTTETVTGFSSACRPCVRKSDKIRNIRDKEKRRKAHKFVNVKRKYGLTKNEWEIILNSQQNGCAICRKIFDHYKDIHVDHCHSTGKVRGLLCNKCNFALGLLCDDPKIIDSAARYLRDGR